MHTSEHEFIIFATAKLNRDVGVLQPCTEHNMVSRSSSKIEVVNLEVVNLKVVNLEVVNLEVVNL